MNLRCPTNVVPFLREIAAKPYLRHGLLLLTSLMGAVLLFAMVWPWRPEISSDTKEFYYPVQKPVTEVTTGRWARHYLAPYYRERSDNLVQAHESKPVFVNALRLWSGTWGRLSPIEQPNARDYMAFMAFTCWLMMLAIWSVGRRLGGASVAALAVLVSMFCPWHLVLMYFPAYTQLSMAILLTAFLLALTRKPRAIFLSGAVGALALLSNAAVIVYLLGLGLVVCAMELPDGRKALRAGVLLVGGMAAVFAVFEILAWSSTVRMLFPSGRVDTPFWLMVKYYQRSLYQNHFSRLDTPKYVGLMFVFLRHNSRVLLVLLLLLPFLFTWEIARRGARALLEPGSLRAAALAVVVPVSAILAIDLRPGVQLGRTYYIGYPLLLIALFILIGDLCRRCRTWRVIAAVLAVLYVAETVWGLADQRRAFHAVGEFICRELRAGRHVAHFRNAGHDRALNAVVANEYGDGIPLTPLDLDNYTDENSLPPSLQGKLILVDNYADRKLYEDDRIAWVVTGPQARSIVGTLEAHRWQPSGEFTWTDSGLGPVVPIPTRQVPFFSHYPLLVFEDEMQTWAYLNREYTGASYRTRQGALTVWSVEAGYVTRGDVTGNGILDYLIFDPNDEEAVLKVGIADKAGLAVPRVWQRYPRFSSRPVMHYGDVNGDGKIDALLCLPPPDGGVLVSVSTGTGFTPPQRWGEFSGAIPEQLSFADVNGNGRVDALWFDRATGSVRVGLSTGEGFSVLQEWLRLEQDHVLEVQYADLNGDGMRDAVVFASDADGVVTIQVMFSTGSGFVPGPTTLAPPGDGYRRVRSGDLNGDGREVLLFFDVSHPDVSALVVLECAPSGFLAPQARWLTPAQGGRDQLYYTDANGDGRTDLVYSRETPAQTLSLVLSTGDGFAAPVPCRDIAKAAPVVR